MAAAANAQLAINLGLYKDLGYDPIKDYAPILNIATSSNVLIVPANSPINSLADLIARAHDKGDQFTFSSGGNGQKGRRLSHLPAVPPLNPGRSAKREGLGQCSAAFSLPPSPPFSLPRRLLFQGERVESHGLAVTGV